MRDILVEKTGGAATAAPPIVEVVHNSDAPSGYGTLTRQTFKALEAVGCETEEFQSGTITDRMPRSPRQAVLRQTPYGPRYVVRGTNTPAKFGTRIRKWVLDHAYVPLEHDEIVEERGTRDAIRVAVGLPENARYDGARTRLLLTMWESSEIPTGFRSWVPHLRRATRVVVPADHSRKVIHDAAPDVPVSIVPLVTDAETWPYIDRPERDTFTFLMVGDLSVRKGFAIAYHAFYRAFEGRKDVRLVLKSRASSDLTTLRFWPKRVPVPESSGNFESVHGDVVHLRSKHERLAFNKERVRYFVTAGDENVRILRGDWRRQALLKLYGAADCFVWPSLGEGWGYPPREAAATGLPVITSAHTGMADATQWAYTIPYKERGIQARFRHWGGVCGWFPRPDLDALVDQMRWVVDNREKARRAGLIASQVVTRRTITDLGNDLLKTMEE